MHAINRNTSIVNHKSINLSNSDSGCTCVHGLGASPEQASRAAPRQCLAAISITQWFNSFTTHKKNMTAVRAARNLTEDLRRRGWGCAASTRATTRDEGMEIEREGCCNARLAAHFVEQPVDTTTNSEEGGSLFGEGESCRGAARGAGHGEAHHWS
jgi:hypothetical protein